MHPHKTNNTYPKYFLKRMRQILRDAMIPTSIAPSLPNRPIIYYAYLNKNFLSAKLIPPYKYIYLPPSLSINPRISSLISLSFFPSPKKKQIKNRKNTIRAEKRFTYIHKHNNDGSCFNQNLISYFLRLFSLPPRHSWYVFSIYIHIYIYI